MHRDTSWVRYLVIILLLSSLAVAGLWLLNRGTSTPPPSLPPPPAPAPVINTPPPSLSPDVDALWQRYETLRRSMPEVTADNPAQAFQSTPESVLNTPTAEAEQNAAQRTREQAREARRKTQDALIAARDEVMATLQQIDPEDTDAIIATMNTFDRRLRAARVDNPIKMDVLRQRLIDSNKLKKLTDELMLHLGRDDATNRKRMLELAAEIKALQSNMVEPIIDMSRLQQGIDDANR